jgi:thymidylate synthase
MTFERFHDAYLSNLERTYNAPHFSNAARGAKSRERLGVLIEVSNPVDRVCYLPERRTNIVFNFAEALWYLAGDDSLEYIGYYAPGIRRYSADGERLTGTAYGPKLRRFGPGRLDQFQRVTSLLRDDDPETKRAVIQIFDANEELAQSNIDVSCTLNWQFLLRDGRLFMFAYMRANDAYRGMVSDFFSFSLVHELMARELKVGLGSYYHVVGSMHAYDTDEPQVRKVLAAAGQSSDRTGMPPSARRFPAMPEGSNWPHIDRVLEWEKAIRLRTRPWSLPELEAERLPAYWHQVVLLFALYRSVVDGGRPDPALVERLIPLYRHLCEAKWPDLMPVLGSPVPARPL